MEKGGHKRSRIGMSIDFLSLLSKVSEEEKRKHDYSSEDLWLVQYELDTQGPYHTDQLIELATTHTEQLSECIVCNMKSKKWKPFFQQRKFQKREKDQSPPLIKEEEFSQSTFMLLIAGQKLGPFSKTRIETLLDDGEIKMQSLISADKGKTWRKIYHYPVFDRRDPEKALNIDTPDESEFEKSKVFTKEYLSQLQEEGGGTSTAIQGALLARQKHLDGKINKALKGHSGQSSGERKISPIKNNKVEKASAFNQQNIIRAALVVLIILAVPLFLTTGKKKGQSRNAKKSDSDSRSRNTASKDSSDSYKEDFEDDNDVDNRPGTSRKSKRSSYSSRSRARDKEISDDDISVPRRSRYRVQEPEEIDFPEPPRRTRPRRQANRPSPRELEEEAYEEEIIDETMDDPEILRDPTRNLAMEKDEFGDEPADLDEVDRDFRGSDALEGEMDELDF